MSIYRGILNSDTDNNIKTKFLKQLVTEQTTIKNEDEYNKRLKFLYRACVGEYSSTTIFFSAVFGSHTFASINNYDKFQTGLSVSLVACYVAIAMIFSYSEISGANFNCCVSFSLWLTGKLSNRKLLLYIICQLLGGLTALFIVYCSFDTQADLFDNLVRSPTGSKGHLFASELLGTFILVYILFTIILEDAEAQKKETKTFKYADGLTVYNTKGNKNTNAPFVFGFILFGILNIGGVSGMALNPVAVITPALVTGKWNLVWLYLIAEFIGASAASLIVHLQQIKVVETLERNTIIGDDINEISAPLIE